jgi:hypothetical protein
MPLALSINLKKHMMLTLSVGRLGVEYIHAESKYEGSSQKGVTNTFQLVANSNLWAAGLIFNLGKKS